MDGKLIHETRGEKSFNYYYDANGYLTDIKYRLTPTGDEYSYYVTHNWRGDVIGIYSGSGVLTAKYEYDTWGNVKSIKDGNGNRITDQNNVGNLNPFRYRGYYYDTESKLYYLMSRYYDPVTHRFINADGYFQTSKGLADTNMSAYALNNPVNKSDPSGEFAITIGAIFSIGFLAITAITLISIWSQPSAQKAVSQAATSISNSFSRAFNSTKTTSKATDTDRDTTASPPRKNTPQYIYRWGNYTDNNLTPKEKDSTTGLSFSTVKPVRKKCVVTTMDAVNSTGTLIAIQDGPTHVSIRPNPAVGTLQEWIEEGPDSTYTQTMKSVTMKWDDLP